MKKLLIYTLLMLMAQLQIFAQQNTCYHNHVTCTEGSDYILRFDCLDCGMENIAVADWKTAADSPLTLTDPYLDVNVDFHDIGQQQVVVSGSGNIYEVCVIDDETGKLVSYKKQWDSPSAAAQIVLPWHPKTRKVTLLAIMQTNDVVGTEVNTDTIWLAQHLSYMPFHSISKMQVNETYNTDEAGLAHPANTIKFWVQAPKEEDILSNDMFVVYRSKTPDFSEAINVGAFSLSDFSRLVNSNGEEYGEYVCVDEKEEARYNTMYEEMDTIVRAKSKATSAYANSEDISSIDKVILDGFYTHPSQPVYYCVTRAMVQSLWSEHYGKFTLTDTLDVSSQLPSVTKVEIQQDANWSSNKRSKIHVELDNPLPWEYNDLLEKNTVSSILQNAGLNARRYLWDEKAYIEVTRFSPQDEWDNGVDPAAATFTIDGSKVSWNEEKGVFEAELEDLQALPYLHYYYNAVLKRGDSNYPLSYNNTDATSSEEDANRCWSETAALIGNFTATREAYPGAVLLKWQLGSGNSDDLYVLRREYSNTDKQNEWEVLKSFDASDKSYKDNTALSGHVYEYMLKTTCSYRNMVLEDSCKVIGWGSFRTHITGHITMPNGTGVAGEMVKITRVEPIYIEDVKDDLGNVIMPGYHDGVVADARLRRVAEHETETYTVLYTDSVITDETGMFSFDNLLYKGEGTGYEIQLPGVFLYGGKPVQKVTLPSLNAENNSIDDARFILEDVATFSGRVLFSQSTVPVRDAFFILNDKDTLCTASGERIKTDANGKFTLTVPAGRKISLRVAKDGHTFDEGGYVLLDGKKKITPTVDGSPYEIRQINDNTRVRLVGRVAGGNVQARKQLGFSMSKNNLGDDPTIVLQLDGDNTSWLVYKQDKPDDTTIKQTIQHPYKGLYPTADIKTEVTHEKKRIVINPDPTTGEFFVDLIPATYKVSQLSAHGYATLYSKGEGLDILDLEKNIETKTMVSQTDAKMTFPYNATYIRNYHKAATVTYEQILYGEALPYYGEGSFDRKNLYGENVEHSIAWYDAEERTAKYIFGYPVFVSGNRYLLKAAAHEDYYYNNDETNTLDQVPVEAGTLHVQNGLLSSTSNATYELDTNGTATFPFYAGNPVFSLTDEEALRSLNISVEVNDYYYEAEPLRGFVTGNREVGVDAVPLLTAPGQIKVLDVLHDPQGANSYAYREKGTSYTWDKDDLSIKDHSLNFNIEVGFSRKLENEFGVGAIGAIAMVGTRTIEYSAGVAVDINHQIYTEHERTRGNYTMTLNERVQTSDDPADVGAMADVYIGVLNSYQLYKTESFDVIDSLTYKLVKGAIDRGAVKLVKASEDGSSYLVIGDKLAFGQGVDRTFIYSQKHIVGTLIPDMQKRVAESILTGPFATDDENQAYFDNLRDVNKQSYYFYAQDGSHLRSLYGENAIDSVDIYLNTINNWQMIIEANEANKINIYGNAGQKVNKLNKKYSIAGSAVEYHEEASAYYNHDVWSPAHSTTVGVGIKAGGGVSNEKKPKEGDDKKDDSKDDKKDDKKDDNGNSNDSDKKDDSSGDGSSTGDSGNSGSSGDSGNSGSSGDSSNSGNSSGNSGNSGDSGSSGSSGDSSNSGNSSGDSGNSGSSGDSSNSGDSGNSSSNTNTNPSKVRSIGSRHYATTTTAPSSNQTPQTGGAASSSSGGSGGGGKEQKVGVSALGISGAFGISWSDDSGGETDFSYSKVESTGYGFVISTNDNGYMDVNVYNEEAVNAKDLGINEKNLNFIQDQEGDIGKDDISSAVAHNFVFRTMAGAVRNPWYEPDSTLYYTESGQSVPLGSRLLKIDNPRIYVDKAVVNNMPDDEKAVFQIRLINETEINPGTQYLNPSVFVLSVDDESNPNGAKIMMDGAPLTIGKTFELAPGASIVKTLEVERGLNYDFENMKLVFADAAGSLSDMASISVHYLPVASPINIATPEDKWTMNTLSAYDKDGKYYIPVTLDGFNVNSEGFHHIELQYKKETDGESQWTKVCGYYTDEQLMKEATGDNYLIPTTGKINDIPFYGEKDPVEMKYNLRAVAFRKLGTGFVTRISNVLTGTKDTRNPRVFGTPKPANGILTFADVISIPFNEPIAYNYLDETANFSVTGYYNDSETSYKTALYFDGSSDVPTSKVSRNLTGVDFTVDAMVKLVSDAEGEVISIANEELGSNTSADKSQYMKFTASKNALRFYTNGYTYTSKALNKWDFSAGLNRVAMTFTQADEEHTAYGQPQVKFYVNGEYIELLSVSANGTAVKNPADPTYFVDCDAYGKVNVGNGLKGNITDIRLWTRALPDYEITQKRNKRISTSDPGLLAHWTMNEGTSGVAHDEVNGADLSFSHQTWQSTEKQYSLHLDGEQITLRNVDEVGRFNSYDYTLSLWAQVDKLDTDSVTIFRTGEQAKGSNFLRLGTQGGNLTLSTSNDEVGAYTHTIAPQSSITDGKWHNIIVVANKSQNVGAIYLDGVLANSISGEELAGTSSTNVILGDAKFHGRIDDISFWDHAFPANTVSTLHNRTASGYEMGLLLNMPFEQTLSNSQGTLETHFSALNMIYKPLDEGGYAAFDSLFSASIMNDNAKMQKLADSNNFCPLEPTTGITNLGFTWTATDNELQINLLAKDSKINHQNVTVVVRGVEDLAGNSMVNPQRVMLYVNKNVIEWEKKKLKIDVPYGHGATLNAKFSNICGRQVNYTLSEYASWLSVNRSQGYLDPLAEDEIEVSISDNIAPGEYTTVIDICDDNGLYSNLPVVVNVIAEEPTWDVTNDPKYNIQMNVTGQVKLKNSAGVEFIDMDKRDIVYAFCDTVCVGKAKLTISDTDSYLYMTVKGSSAMCGTSTTNGEVINFRVWRPSTGIVTYLTPNYTKNGTAMSDIYFTKNDIVGSHTTPVLFTESTQLAQQLNLKKGWNWVSFYLKPKQAKGIANLFESSNVFSTNDIICNLTSTRFSQIQSDGVWSNGLKALDITTNNVYQIYVNNDCSPVVIGEAVTGSARQVSIKKANTWNDLAYLCSTSKPITQALSDYNVGTKAQNGAIVMGRNQFAMLENGKWYGSLDYMQPGQGYYLFHVGSAATTILYPDDEVVASNKTSRKANTNNMAKANVAVSSPYKSNMPVVAAFTEDSDLQEGDELVAYSGDMEIGRALVQTTDEKLQRFFIMISAESNSDITWSHERNGEKVASARSQVRYNPMSAVGSIDNPLMIDFIEGNVKDSVTYYTTDGVQVTNMNSSRKRVLIGDDGNKIVK